MTISKIDTLIKLLKEYNNYFFSGQSEAIKSLLYDADNHILDIMDNFMRESKDKLLTTEDLKDFLKDELTN